MLTAHANTTTDEFIAQLRTHVIAFGCGPHVVDCVDNLVGADENEDQHAAELRTAEDDARTETKAAILEAVKEWAVMSLGEETMKDELLAVIKEA